MVSVCVCVRVCVCQFTAINPKRPGFRRREREREREREHSTPWPHIHWPLEAWLTLLNEKLEIRKARTAGPTNFDLIRTVYREELSTLVVTVMPDIYPNSAQYGTGPLF